MTHPTAHTVADALDALRETTPLVQSLTNVVSANFVTNVLLAAGASNAHIDNVHEAVAFAAIAGVVLINLGTPDDGTAEAFVLAADGAVAAGTPWVLDPVGVGGLPWRTSLAADLLTRRPTAVRGKSESLGGAVVRGAEVDQYPSCDRRECGSFVHVVDVCVARTRRKKDVGDEVRRDDVGE